MAEEVQQSKPEFKIDDNRGYGMGAITLLFLISAILAVLFLIFLFLYNYSLKNQIADLNSQKSQILSQVELPENKALVETINSTAGAIVDLKSIYTPNTFKTSDFLSEFPKSINKNVQINNLSLEGDNSLKIDATTQNLSTLALFLESLKQTGYIEQIRLVGVSNESVEGNNVAKFSISAILNRDLAYAKLLKSREPLVPETQSLENTTTETAEPNLDDTSTAEEPFAAPAL